MSDDASGEGTFTIDCNTCLGTGTTACNECVVGHVLANEGGPIELVVAPVPPTDDTARVVRLMTRAGLLDDPPVMVSPEDFASLARHPSGAMRSP